MKYLLTVAYDGSLYHGFQVQKEKPTVQKQLQDAVEAVMGKRYAITGCSRTDSGVHARDFKATMSTDKDAPNIPPDKLPSALNSCLPESIVIKAARVVSDSFHPRYCVKMKEYEYLIYNSEIRDPFMSKRAYFYPILLDEKIMDKAANFFVGKHDFSAFMASGSDVIDRERTIYSCNVTRDGDVISVRVSGDGFLYNMVRIMVGTLIEVSKGKINCYDVLKIIESKDRKKAGFTVPPEGLYLNKVTY